MIKTGVYTRNDKDFNFEFKTNLNAEQKTSFVNGVTYLLVGDNYNFIVKDLLFDLFIVKFFTNVEVSDIMQSQSILNETENLLPLP